MHRGADFKSLRLWAVSAPWAERASCLGQRVVAWAWLRVFVAWSNPNFRVCQHHSPSSPIIMFCLFLPSWHPRPSTKLFGGHQQPLEVTTQLRLANFGWTVRGILGPVESCKQRHGNTMKDMEYVAPTHLWLDLQRFECQFEGMKVEVDNA